VSIIENIIGIVISILAFLISVSCHEFAHGYSAYLMGDPTAKINKRLSLNPARHFDLFSILFFVIFHFGWAKGVPVDPRYFKNPKKGLVYSSLAGPLTNIVLAFISLIIFKLLLKISFTSHVLYVIFTYIAMFFNYMISVNAMLAIFNLIPIPPLDGSKIFLAFLPEELYFKALSYDRYMMIVSLILVYTGVLDKFIFTGVNNLVNILERIVGVFI
jgi:Zn-dependent protease